jgi:hypothetical protein
MATRHLGNWGRRVVSGTSRVSEGQGKGTGHRISISHLCTKVKSNIGSAPVDNKMKKGVV